MLFTLFLAGAAVGGAGLGLIGRLQARDLRRRLAADANVRADLEARLAGLHAAAARDALADRSALQLLNDLAVEARSPLNTIAGFGDLMRLNRAADPLSVRQAQALDHIAGAGQTLAALLDEASDLARLKAGDLDLAPERVDPRLVARQVCERLAAQAEAAGVALNAPPPGAGLLVLADRARLRQMLAALVSNAIVGNRPGGSVHVEARVLGPSVSICVHDTGPGLEDAALADLFKPLRDTAGSGVGAGLAVSRALAQAMGGGLHAVSRRGEGSTFTLVLPRVGAPELDASQTSGAVAGSPRPRRLGPATLLYIEDNASNIALMRRVLGLIDADLSLHVAESGAEGLALARDLRPDIVILDTALPDLDGVALRRQLAMEPLTRDTPVLALSSRTGVDDRRRALQAGFAAYLAKPLDIAAFADALAKALARAPVRAAQRAA